MKIIDLSDATNDYQGLSKVYEALDIEQIDDEKYQIYMPDDENFYSAYYRISDEGISFLKHADIVTSEYKGGSYIGSKEHPYRVLIRVKDDLKELDVHPECTCVSKEMAKEHSYLEKVVFHSNVLTIPYQAFGRCNKLKTVIFDCKESVVVNGGFCGSSQISDIQYGDCDYKFYNYAFTSEFPYFIFPRRLVNFNDFIHIDKIIWVPKEVTSLVPLIKPQVRYGTSERAPFFYEIYYEGDCKDLKLQNYEHSYSESPADYAENFHRSSGSFRYTSIDDPDIYADDERSKHHSFVSLEDFLKVIRGC